MTTSDYDFDELNEILAGIHKSGGFDPKPVDLGALAGIPNGAGSDTKPRDRGATSAVVWQPVVGSEFYKSYFHYRATPALEGFWDGAKLNWIVPDRQPRLWKNSQNSYLLESRPPRQSQTSRIRTANSTCSYRRCTGP